MLPALPTGMHSCVELVQRLDQLEGGGLLALQAQRVDRVDQRDRVAAGELAHELERLVEVAAQGDDARAVHERLGELAGGDLALRHDHRAAQAGTRCVGGQAGSGVARRGADDRLGPAAHRVGHRARHAAVLERPRGVGALELQMDLHPNLLRQPRGVHERRRPLLQRHDRVAAVEGQAVAVALDEAGHQAPGATGGPSTTRTPRRSRGSRAVASARSPARRSSPRRRRSAIRGSGGSPSPGGRSRRGRAARRS